MSIRDEESRPQTNWQPPALLDAQKYVLNGSTMGRNTRFRVRTLPTTYIKEMREGWNHVKQKLVKGQLFPTINHGQWAGCGIEECLFV